MKIVVITRHASLVTYLREIGVLTDADVNVIAQATPDDVRDAHVIGVLPLHLAALAAQVTTLDLDLPPELRGKELALEQLRECARGTTTYVVRRVS
jgi:putative CRISPR-associated protein (TIGR02620 family)